VSSVSFTGLTSGVDWRSLITELMQLERRPLTRLESRKKDLDADKSAWSDVKTALTDLKGVVDDFKLSSTLQGLKASSGDEDVVTATATSSANPGSHTITVAQLAQAHSVASDQQADSSSALGLSGAFTIGGHSHTVTADQSLADIRDLINDSSKTSGARATIVDNRLVITATATGAAGTMSFGDTDGVLESLGVLDATKAVKTEVAAAQDASFTVDGLAITRSSNDPSDVIEGVTLHLKGVDAQPVALTLEQDREAAVEAVKAFVEAYNGALGKVRSLRDKGGALYGDVTLLRLEAELRTQVNDTVDGLSGDYRCLADLGVKTTDQSGTLTVDETRLNECLEEDAAAVMELFYAADGGITGVSERLSSTVDLWTIYGEGIIPGRISSLDARITSVEDQIGRLEDRLSKRESTLTQQFISMEQSLTMFQSQGLWMQSQITGLL